MPVCSAGVSACGFGLGAVFPAAPIAPESGEDAPENPQGAGAGAYTDLGRYRQVLGSPKKLFFMPAREAAGKSNAIGQPAMFIRWAQC